MSEKGQQLREYANYLVEVMPRWIQEARVTQLDELEVRSRCCGVCAAPSLAWFRQRSICLTRCCLWLGPCAGDLRAPATLAREAQCKCQDIHTAE